MKIYEKHVRPSSSAASFPATLRTQGIPSHDLKEVTTSRRCPGHTTSRPQGGVEEEEVLVVFLFLLLARDDTRLRTRWRIIMCFRTLFSHYVMCSTPSMLCT